MKRIHTALALIICLGVLAPALLSAAESEKKPAVKKESPADKAKGAKDGRDGAKGPRVPNQVRPGSQAEADYK